MVEVENADCSGIFIQVAEEEAASVGELVGYDGPGRVKALGVEDFEDNFRRSVLSPSSPYGSKNGRAQGLELGGRGPDPLCAIQHGADAGGRQEVGSGVRGQRKVCYTPGSLLGSVETSMNQPLAFSSPCGDMVAHKFVIQHHLKRRAMDSGLSQLLPVVGIGRPGRSLGNVGNVSGEGVKGEDSVEGAEKLVRVGVADVAVVDN